MVLSWPEASQQGTRAQLRIRGPLCAGPERFTAHARWRLAPSVHRLTISGGSSECTLRYRSGCLRDSGAVAPSALLHRMRGRQTLPISRWRCANDVCMYFTLELAWPPTVFQVCVALPALPREYLAHIIRACIAQSLELLPNREPFRTKSMPDDHSKSVPPLPIPNRTVKRSYADDSAATSVKVGHRQASYVEPTQSA